MVLRVDLDRFIVEVRERLPGVVIYVEPRHSGTFLSAGNPEIPLFVFAESTESLTEVERMLANAELQAVAGSWVASGSEVGSSPLPFVGAVSYRSSEEKPGIWIDAYYSEPSPAEVLKRLYDELRSSGELGDVSFEEFLRLTHANVVIVGPHDLTRYALQNANAP